MGGKAVLAGCALAMLVVSVAGQGCPSAVCNSYFANAMGGPVDCCNHNYDANPKCVWGGSPVSFTRTRFCTKDGKTYNVLRPSNYQGPPANSECRCKEATASLTPSIKMTVEMKAKSGKDIQGFDIGCGGQSYCKVCGGLQSVQGACAGQGRCVAFTYEAATGCGFLKFAAEPMTDRAGWGVYSRL